MQEHKETETNRIIEKLLDKYEPPKSKIHRNLNSAGFRSAGEVRETVERVQLRYIIESAAQVVNI